MQNSREQLERRRRELARRRIAQDARRRELAERERLYQEEAELEEQEDELLEEEERLDYLERGLEYPGDSYPIDSRGAEARPFKPNFIVIGIGALPIILSAISIFGDIENTLIAIYTLPFALCIFWAVWKFFTEDVREDGCFKILLIALAGAMVVGAIGMFFEFLGFWGNIVMMLLGAIVCVLGFLGVGNTNENEEMDYD